MISSRHDFLPFSGKRLSLLLLVVITHSAFSYERAPFDDLDTYCVNDWWNRDACPIVDLKVERDQIIVFGMYTVFNGTLKLSAQLYPLYPDESREVILEVKDMYGNWKEIARESVIEIGWSAHFRIDAWDHSKDISYRLRHELGSTFEGLIRKDPVDKNEIVVAAFTGNSNKDRGLRPNYVRNVNFQDPDLVFFSGDQSYDHKEHTAAWIKFGLQFRDIFRNRPCVAIPDDHDIGQGNLWGEGGKVSHRGPAGDDGGYYLHPEYIKMVERCQTWNLPDPYDPTPVKQGIGVYYTNLIVGGVDFVVIEDRKFKSGPGGKIPQQGPRPDHIINPDYEPASVDLPGLKLLGDRQLAFLEDWSDDWDGVQLKSVLSQTGFFGAAHIHGKDQVRLHADLDSNGWPQTRRNIALRLFKKAKAIHIAGDQHLGVAGQYGIDNFRDGTWLFMVPASVNNYYSRWWKPLEEENGVHHNPDNPLPWTGDYKDGLGNRFTMHAYANPGSDSFGAGYGLIRFNKAHKTATMECWPRYADVTKIYAKQFPGWPVTVNMD